MDIPLDELIYVEAISNSSTGAAVDADSTPTFAVYEEATDTDIGVGGNMTKRTSLTGNYRASFTASAANGFELGKFYAVIGTATIGGIVCKGILRTFRIIAAEIVAGYPPADTLKVGGTTQTARDLGASVLLSPGTGTGQIKIASGYISPNWGDVGNPTTTLNLSGTTTSVVGSVTGSVGSITGNVGGNVSGSVGSIATGGITANSFAADAITDAKVASDVTIASVTGSVGSVVNNVGGNVNGNVNGNVVGSTGSVTGSVGSVTGSVGSVAGNVSGSVQGDVAGKVIGGGASSITGDGVRAASVTGSVGSVTGSVGSVTGSVGSITGSVGGDVSGKVLGGGSGTITNDGVRASSVTGDVGGNVVGSVGSVVGSVGGNVVGSVGSVIGSVGSIVADVNVSDTDVRGAIGLSSADLDTQLANIRKIQQADYYIDTTVTPWALVFVERGGGTTGTDIVELFRKKLYDVSGNPITDTETVIGQAIDE